MSTQERATTGLSIPTLRNWILVALLVGVSIYTAIMFSFAENLSRRFGPEVQQDLQWRVQRGAVELSKACELAVAIADPAEVKGCFGPYATSSDVQALVVVNADGEPIVVHGATEQPHSRLFAGEPRSLSVSGGALVSWAPVEIEGTELGRIAVVVSLDRLVQANQLLERSSQATIAGGLGGLVFGALVVIFFTRAVGLRDAQLSDYAANLEGMVESRTKELDARNKGMALVLDNVAQGFITIDYDGAMAAERSAVVDRWFGTPQEGMSLADYLEQVSPNTGLWVDIGLEQLRDDLMPAELIIEQMPGRIQTDGGTFDLAYRPIEGDVPKLLVIISDVTEAVAHERSEREQRELVALFQRISVDRAGVEEFVTEAASLVQALRTEQDPVLQGRLVHTLKGNCAIYGLESYAALAHDIESELVETGENLSDSHREQLVTMWKDAMNRVGQLMGSAKEGVLEVHEVELRAAAERVRSGGTADELLELFASWKLEPASRRLERLGQQAVALARRLGKPEPNIVVEGNRVRLRAGNWPGVFAALVHVVRNAMDHGVEGAAARIEAGKDEAGTVRLTTTRTGTRVKIEIADDGAGVDFERLADKARAAGLPSDDHQALVEALFSDGLSTKDAANDVSGRGVGMAAVRQTVLDAGGSLDVISERNKGTTFVFVLDEARMEQLSSKEPGISASLVPYQVG